MIERPKPTEIWDKYGVYTLIFDDMTEEEAVREIVKILENGVPEERKVNRIPDFLQE